MKTGDFTIDAGQPYTFTYNPAKKGLRTVLGDLEADIMDILWTWGRGTVREVHGRLNQKRPLAYTTVMTVMSRLASKGLLRKEKVGNAFVYHPSSSREIFTASTVKKILNGLLDDFSQPTMRQFVESIETTHPEKIDELARLVARQQEQRME